MPNEILAFVAAGVFGIAMITLFSATFFTVEQYTVAIVERLGKFVRGAGPGIRAKVPFVDSVVGTINLRVQKMDVEVKAKGKDNVPVRVVVALEYVISPSAAYDAFYKLDDAPCQMSSYVFDFVRAQVSKFGIEDVLEEGDVISGVVKEKLVDAMGGSGYEIREALVTDIGQSEKRGTDMGKCIEAVSPAVETSNHHLPHRNFSIRVERGLDARVGRDRISTYDTKEPTRA